MDPMLAARFNGYWFASLLAPALVMLVATFFSRRWTLVLGVMVSLCATFVLSHLAVERKWRLRGEIAVTQADRDYASADGANRMAAILVIGPVEAIVFTAAWGFVGWRSWRRIRRLRAVRRPGSSNP